MKDPVGILHEYFHNPTPFSEMDFDDKSIFIDKRIKRIKSIARKKIVCERLKVYESYVKGVDPYSDLDVAGLEELKRSWRMIQSYEEELRMLQDS